MKELKFFQDITKDSVLEAGGKGASLGEMIQAGIVVPPGFVVLASAFDRFLDETDLNVEIRARLKEVKPDDMNTVERASNVIQDVMHDRPVPEDIQEAVLKAFDELGAQFVAVRSSATAEDSSSASWAGELDTYLNTTRKDVVQKVKECWASLFTPRAIFYRHEKKLIDYNISVAVVVQKMVQSEISGIAFTVHPVTEDQDQMIIEAGLGLGEAIVSGQVTPDSYVVSKNEKSILDINIGSQTRKLVRFQEGLVGEKAGFNVWVDLTKEESQKQKLSGKRIIELAEICIKIEAHYGFACDIEWVFEGGTFYITQSRPITTLKK